MDKFLQSITTSFGVQLREMNTTIEKMKDDGDRYNQVDERVANMEKKFSMIDETSEIIADESNKVHEDQNHGEAEATGFHCDSSEQEVGQLLREAIIEIGMSTENVMIKCLVTPVSYSFTHFNDNNERNKYVRSANMARKEMRGRKISHSMDAWWILCFLYIVPEASRKWRRWIRTLWEKSKTNVTELNASNHEPVFGITSMSNRIMINAKNTIMKERTWINRVAQRDVKRSGELLNMESRNLVPGDLVKLSLVGLIPADCVGREIWTRPRWPESLCWLPWERETRLPREACHDQVWFPMCETIWGVQDCTCMSLLTLTTCESLSRYTGYSPNDVWSDLKQLRAHEQGELSDTWSELRFVIAGGNVACLSSYVPRATWVASVLSSVLLVFSQMTVHACVAWLKTLDPQVIWKSVHLMIHWSLFVPGHKAAFQYARSEYARHVNARAPESIAGRDIYSQMQKKDFTPEKVGLRRISLNRFFKHVSVDGRIVVRTCQSGSPQVPQISRHRNRGRRTSGDARHIPKKTTTKWQGVTATEPKRPWIIRWCEIENDGSCRRRRDE